MKEELQRDLVFLSNIIVVEAFSTANTRNITTAAQLVNTNVLASLPVRSTHLPSLKQMTAELVRAMALAHQPTQNTVPALKTRAGWFVAAIEFLFRFDEVMTLLDQHITKLIPVREKFLTKPPPEETQLSPSQTSDSQTEQDDSTQDAVVPTPAGDNEPPPEPTLDQLLGTGKGAFEASFRQVFVGTHQLTKSPQELSFYKHVSDLRNKNQRVVNDAVRAKFIKELSKITIPEGQDLIQRLGVALGKIRQARSELGSANPVALATLFGIPVQSS